MHPLRRALPLLALLLSACGSTYYMVIGITADQYRANTGAHR